MSSTLPAVAATPGLEPSVVSLEVQGPNDTSHIPLRADYLSLVTSITVHQVWDGADELTIEMVAWDEFQADYAVLGEEILAPGNSVIVRAGYGSASTIIGRFDIIQHNPSLTGDVPKVTITGFDPFHSLMDNHWPGDYGGRSKRDRRGGGIKTYTDVMLIMARKYGFGFLADQAIDIPFRTRKVRRRKKAVRTVIENGKPVKKRVTLKGPDGKPIYEKKTRKSRIVKNAGESDAKMVKQLAGYTGFLHPKVRYFDRVPVATQAKYAVAENTDGNDVMVFEKPDLKRQQSRTGAFNLVYSSRGERPSTISSFEPQLSTKEIPTAVRVQGIVRVPVGSKGKSRKRLLIVEAELTQPEQIRQRANLLRRAARERNPQKRAELESQAERIGGRITVSRVESRTLGKRDKKKYRGSAGTAMIEILGKDKRPVKEYDPKKKRKIQTLRREVIGGTIVVANDAELEAIAKGWLMSRLSLYITASANIENVAGAEKLYPQQFHALRGLPWEYEGAYMLKECTHTWTPSAGHSVALEMSKLAEAPPMKTTGARA